MNRKLRRWLLLSSLQLLLYGALVAAYLFFVLIFLTDWILQINVKDRYLYAVLSLLLIIAQGMILEAVTSSLMRFFRSRLED